ncbi:hypothetical protein Y032_0491g2397 [Ancylostoma ceylanicum]|uniref:Uncharacterized protein n=1 Tax=Ancylostoma ceylanicum TaxID=53326 RepID=A0A016WV07_9BILA|nr:hypothetical protein Y032_0491g2397 [Ancylostoma ceylanicum]
MSLEFDILSGSSLHLERNLKDKRLTVLQTPHLEGNCLWVKINLFDAGIHFCVVFSTVRASFNRSLLSVALHSIYDRSQTVGVIGGCRTCRNGASHSRR